MLSAASRTRHWSGAVSATEARVTVAFSVTMAQALLVAILWACDALLRAAAFSAPPWITKAFPQRARSVAATVIGAEFHVTCYLRTVLSAKPFYAQALAFHADTTF
jgi:hypothetical protein